MKEKRFFSALTALAASAVLTFPSGAFITVVQSPSANLNSTTTEWAVILPPAINSCAEGITKIELTATLEGDAEKYTQERTSGHYDDGKNTSFVDFDGFIGIGANLEGSDNKYWYSFNFRSLDETAGSSGKLAVKALGNNKFKFTGELGNIKVHASQSDVQFRFQDWGNKSPNYSLTVNEMYVYGPDGNVAIYADASGKLDIRSAASTTAQTQAPETTTTTTTTEATTTTTTTEASETETSVSETTETSTTTSKAAETTTTAAKTTAEDVVTTAAQPESTTTPAPKTADSEFGSRDSTLLIVGIAFGAVIVGVIIALVIMMTKKKK